MKKYEEFEEEEKDAQVDRYSKGQDAEEEACPS